MKFDGTRPGPGRPKGSKTKLTLLSIRERQLSAEMTVLGMGFCPLTAIVKIHREAVSIYENYSTIYKAIQSARERASMIPTEEKSHIYLKIALDSAAEIASYIYPKYKATDKPKPSHFDQLPLKQQLEIAEEIFKSKKEEYESSIEAKSGPVSS